MAAAAFAQTAEPDGYLGVTVPEQLRRRWCGSVHERAECCRRSPRWNHALGLSWVAHDNLCVNNIYRNAGEELRRRYLPGLCAGKLVGALGLDRARSRLRRTRIDAHHRPPTAASTTLLNGSKLYITNWTGGRRALVYAKTAPERGPQGICSPSLSRKGFEGFRGSAKADQDGLPRQPDGGTGGFRRLPRARGQSPRHREWRCRAWS